MPIGRKATVNTTHLHPSGNTFSPDLLGRSRIRLPFTVVIIVISFFSSIKPERSSISSRQPT
jgi:hypothetical protein